MIFECATVLQLAIASAAATFATAIAPAAQAAQEIAMTAEVRCTSPRSYRCPCPASLSVSTMLQRGCAVHVLVSLSETV